VSILPVVSYLSADFIIFGGRIRLIADSSISKACFLISVVESSSLFFIIIILASHYMDASSYIARNQWLLTCFVFFGDSIKLTSGGDAGNE
jgi:hypothetical protein